MPTKITIVNNKGGVGKTTTAVNLAAALAVKGKRVLLVDFDPQGNAGHFLDLVEEVERDENLYTVVDLLRGKPFEPLRNQGTSGLDILPATVRLSFLEPELMSQGADGARRLADALKSIESDYDYVLIDTLPHIGILAMNALCAAPNALIPVQLNAASIPGTLRLSDFVRSLQGTLNPDIRLFGILGTFWEESAARPRRIAEHIKEAFPKTMFETLIHRGRAVADAAGLGRPITVLKPSDRGAQEYTALAEEVIRRGSSN